MAFLFQRLYGSYLHVDGTTLYWKSYLHVDDTTLYWKSCLHADGTMFCL